MNPVRVVSRLGLLPMNSSITHQLALEDMLVPRYVVSAFGENNYVLTVETRFMEAYMFFFARNKKGFYELPTKHGVMTSVHTRDEYVHRMESRSHFSIVAIKNGVVFGCFHNEVPPKKLFQLGVEVNGTKDSQRKKMYRWQSSFHWGMANRKNVLTQTLSTQQTKVLVRQILRDYHFDLSRVIFQESWGRKKSSVATHSFFFESKLDLSTFVVLKYAFNNTHLGTVIHEAAHSIVTSEYSSWKGSIAGHGPEYCLILAELFERYAGIPFEYTYASMKDAGLKVAPKKDFFDGKIFPFYKSGIL